MEKKLNGEISMAEMRRKEHFIKKKLEKMREKDRSTLCTEDLPGGQEDRNEQEAREVRGTGKETK